jgi:transketolase
MAAIGKSALRLVGSHCGVSIGQDGPSQMGLEDIAMMRCLPESIVLYPCDAVSTHKLVEQMARYSGGISYLRTTRMETPVLYDNDEQFPIGGCKVLRKSDKDVACIVAAGVTLHEALKAYDFLVKQNIFVSVIDLYSIKPLDAATLLSVARESGNTIITVEDHYPEGGISEAVMSALCNQNITIHLLAVNHLPRSGSPEELLAFEGIDATAIVKVVKEMNAGTIF